MSNEKFDTNASVTYQGEPDNIDVEQELSDNANDSIAYDPYKLAKALMVIGEKMIGVELYEDYQKPAAFRIIYSILAHDGDEITALFARQSGKSEVVVFSVITLGVLLPMLAKIYPKDLGHFGSGVKMGLYAPQGEQVDTVYRRCMERLLSEPVKMFMDDPDINDATTSTVNFRLKSGTFLTGQSAAKQSKVESKTFHIIFMDESQDMDTDKVRRSIIPMTASTFGTIVRTGTPGRYKGDFYDKIKQNKKDDSKLKGKKTIETKRKHFEYTYEDVIRAKRKQFKKDGVKFHTFYEKAVLRDKKSMGEKSEAFRMAYKVEWLLEIGMFISEEELETMCYNKRISFPKPEKDDFIIAGLDIASARNSTVLTTGKTDYIAQDIGERPVKTIMDWLTLGGMNYEKQFQILADKLMQDRVKVLYTDNTGVGRALTDTLMWHLSDYIDIIPCTFTPAFKSDMWKALDEDIENRKLVIPANKMVRDKQEFKDFEEQMTNLQKFWRGSYMVCQKTQGYEDDYCDSLGLFNMAGNHLYVPQNEVEETENILMNTSFQASLMDRSSY